MAGDLDCRKSSSGYLFTFVGGAISWQLKLQKCVSLSTTEAEYIAATEAGKKMLWMKQFLQELDLKHRDYIVLCDSQSAIEHYVSCKDEAHRCEISLDHEGY